MRLAALALCLLAAAAPAMAQPADGAGRVAIALELAYRERIALPPGSTAEAVLRVGGREVARAEAATAGRQVPIPLVIEAPAGALRPGEEAEVMARLGLPGGGAAWSATRTLRLQDPLPSRIALGPLLLRRVAAGGGAAAPAGMATFYDCDGVRVAVTPTAEGITLTRHGDPLPLARTPAASGARYEGRSTEGAVLFRDRGGEAVLSISTAAPQTCRRVTDPGPFLYHAIGNEPFWSLRIEGERARLTRGIEMTVVEARLGAPTRTAEGGTTLESVAGEPRLGIEITAGPCSDTMSDIRHPDRVTVVQGADRFQGCGGTPEARLLGPAWTIASIAGAAPAGDHPVTLAFQADGRMGGRGPCNTYGGGWSIRDWSLATTAIFSTMMACPEPAMTQERALFDILGKPRAHRIREDGALVIEGPDGAELVARR